MNKSGKRWENNTHTQYNLIKREINTKIEVEVKWMKR